MTLSYWNGTILGPYKVSQPTFRPISKIESTVCKSTVDRSTPKKHQFSPSATRSTSHRSTRLTAESKISTSSRPGRIRPPSNSCWLRSRTKWWPIRDSSSLEKMLIIENDHSRPKHMQSSKGGRRDWGISWKGLYNLRK